MSDHPDITDRAGEPARGSSQGADCVEVAVTDPRTQPLTTTYDEPSRGRSRRPSAVPAGYGRVTAQSRPDRRRAHAALVAPSSPDGSTSTSSTSELLRGNPLGDPHERPLWVYVPPGYDDDPDQRYPSVYVIQGYTGHLGDVGATARRSGSRSPRPPTQVFARGDAPPAIVVYVDAWTSLRRQPVRRLPRHRPLPLLPVRRGRAVGRRALPDPAPTATTGRSAASPAAATAR